MPGEIIFIIVCAGNESAYAWGDIVVIKNAAGGKLLVATAGGIRVDVVKEALMSGADILMGAI